MHDIEPHFNWRDRYRSDRDPQSPFYGREYSEFGYHNKVYNYLLHPQWDEFGSETLYLKIIFADYEERYAIIELIGEWNDVLHNDVMHLKREVIDELLVAGIRHFILIAEQILTFYGDDDSYYEEWYQEVSDGNGWIVMINTLTHVHQELTDTRLDQYLHFGEIFNNLNWRPQKPERIYEAIEGLLQNEQRRIY